MRHVVKSTYQHCSCHRRYLLWKNDGNAVGQPTHIWLQPLSEDGLRMAAAPKRLISNDQARCLSALHHAVGLQDARLQLAAGFSASPLQTSQYLVMKCTFRYTLTA